MVEFGEKVKKLREEKGMTQQTMAEQLYVTRQAVSRWECGARYPDLLTAKKIAVILETSLDELLSGESIKNDVEKEQLLSGRIQMIVQSALYASTAVVYLLLCVVSVYAIVRPDAALGGTPAGKPDAVIYAADILRLIYFAAAAAGFVLSLQNKLTARLTGCIMCVPYAMAAVSFLVTYINMKIKNNGSMGWTAWLTDFALPLALAACIVLYFTQQGYKIPFAVVAGISIGAIFYLAYTYRLRFRRFTDLGFVVTTVHMTGKAGMALLLGYQAYIWKKRRKRSFFVSEGKLHC